MTVSQVALAVMLLSCFLGGVAISPVYDVLLIPRTLLCGTWLPWITLLRGRLSLPLALKPWRKLQHPENMRQTKPKRSGKWHLVMSYALTAVADFGFCLIAAVSLILILYLTNDGAFRLSALTFMLFGLLLGRMTLARWMVLAAQLLYTVLRAGIAWITAMLVYLPLTLCVCVWLRSAPLRRRALVWFCQKKQERKARREAKKAANVLQDEKQPGAMRPQPDGRRVFCAGRAHEIKPELERRGHYESIR